MHLGEDINLLVVSVSINAIIYENAKMMFFVNLSVKEKRNNVYLSSLWFQNRIEL